MAATRLAASLAKKKCPPTPPTAGLQTQNFLKGFPPQEQLASPGDSPNQLVKVQHSKRPAISKGALLLEEFGCLREKAHEGALRIYNQYALRPLTRNPPKGILLDSKPKVCRFRDGQFTGLTLMLCEQNFRRWRLGFRQDLAPRGQAFPRNAPLLWWEEDSAGACLQVDGRVKKGTCNIPGSLKPAQDVGKRSPQTSEAEKPLHYELFSLVVPQESLLQLARRGLLVVVEQSCAT